MGFLKGAEKIGGSSKIDGMGWWGGGGGGLRQKRGEEGGGGGGGGGLEPIHEGAWEGLKIVFLKSR